MILVVPLSTMVPDTSARFLKLILFLSRIGFTPIARAFPCPIFEVPAKEVFQRSRRANRMDPELSKVILTCEGKSPGLA